MNILLLLVPLSVLLLGVAVWAFVWAVRRGQFDELDSPALDILADDPKEAPLPGQRRPGQATRRTDGPDRGATPDGDAD